MNIQTYNNLSANRTFKGNTETPKTCFTNKFETKLKNSADINDCISVPRTIFKGYLGIMFGTATASLAALMKPSKLKTALNVTAIGLSTFGTWSFARPYVLKGSVPTVKPNTNTKA